MGQRIRLRAAFFARISGSWIARQYPFTFEIQISPEQPEGVPQENWLPSGGKDEQLDVIMRVYAPDSEAMKTWKAPKAEKIE